MKTIKQFVVAPDSFKGTMEAQKVCEIISASIKRHFPASQVTCVPMADGGEGMVDAYLNILGGCKVPLTVTGLLGKPVDCSYGVLPDGTAVMEMAACAGLLLLNDEDTPDPLHTTTYGVGEMLTHAEQHGIRRVLLGIGGSATIDCGLGMAQALGYRFYDKDGAQLLAATYNMEKIEAIEKPERLPALELIVACDVDNPLCGENGATYTFGKQKGVSEEMMPVLDANMEHLAGVIAKELGADVKDLPGAGAAGGMGAALMAFLGAQLHPGADLLLDVVKFDQMMEDTDIVFTGEGRIDWQSARGKVPVSVARRAKKAGVPCIALCGSVGEGAERVYDHGVTAVFSSVGEACSFEQIKKNCAKNLRILSDAVMRVLLTGEMVEKWNCRTPVVINHKRPHELQENNRQ